MRCGVRVGLVALLPLCGVLTACAPLIRGREGVRAMYQDVMGSGMVKSFDATTTHLEVAPSGDIGYEYGINRMTLTTPDGDMLDVGKYLAIWKKVDGQWYAAVLAFNSDAPAPTPVASAGM